MFSPHELQRFAGITPVVSRSYATAKPGTLLYHVTGLLVVDGLHRAMIQILSGWNIYIAASEVSSILESRISGTAAAGSIEETGRVLSWQFLVSCYFPCLISRLGVGDGIGRVWGLRNVQGWYITISSQLLP
jgi:hypothetical protein